MSLLPFCSSSFVSSVVLFDLLVNILGHNLAEPAYEAEVAQLEYKLVAGEHGLVIKVKGFNHKLPVSDLIQFRPSHTGVCVCLVNEATCLLMQDFLSHSLTTLLSTVAVPPDYRPPG